MIPAPFDYEVADSLDDAVQRLRHHGEDARLIAGGQSLLPLMKLRLVRPAVLVDIGRLGALSFVREAYGHLKIGPLTRHVDLVRSPILHARCAILSHAAGLVGDPQVRHRGTIGGSLGHADPASDLATVLVTLDAEVLVRGPGTERVMSITDLFAGYCVTTLAPHEVIAEIRVPPLEPSDGWAYKKFAVRAQSAVVSCAVVLRRPDGELREAAIALGNMGSTTLRARQAEQLIQEGGLDAIADSAQAVAEGTSPPSDIDASAEYRRHLARVLSRRGLLRAAARQEAR